MAEYIDRSKLEFDFRQCNRTDSNWTPQRVVQMIHRQPAADVALVQHGLWIAVDEYMTDECSNCGARINIEEFDDCSYHPKYGNVRLDYCPNCGAKMDGDGNG